jgi:hypothetical protein
MSSTQLYRLSGFALLASGVVSVIGYGIGTFQSDTDVSAITSTPYIVASLLTFVGAALSVLGLPGMIARQADRAGILGVIGGVAVMLVQLIYGIANGFVDVTVFPALVADPSTRAFALQGPPPLMNIFYMVGMASGIIGALALGIATLRARVFPRWIGVLLLLTVVAEIPTFLEMPFLSNLAPIVSSVALLGAGIALMSPKHTPAVEPARATAAAAI